MPLDLDAFADGIDGLQREIRRAPIDVGMAAAVVTHLGRALAAARGGVVERRVDPGMDEAARQARLMGGFDDAFMRRG